MIYLIQNRKEYDYDIRAIVLAFFEREKIIDVTGEELGKEDPRFLLAFEFGDNQIQGRIEEKGSLLVQRTICCEYEDHKEARKEVDKFIYQLLSDYSKRTLPWGTLTGIRPTKIIFQWLLEGLDDEQIEKRFCDTYLAEGQKARVCTRVARKEQEVLKRITYEDEYSIYIGIPFCPSTCLYCSFTSFPLAGYGDRVESYLQALYKEMQYVAKTYAGRKLTTIYIGGGTPTSLNENQLDDLLCQIEKTFDFTYVREFTVEAGRPDSITRGKLEVMKSHPVTRISINPQTMNDETLKLIGRAHTAKETIEAFYLAREVGFSNINMDIITGLPGEDISHVEKTLKEIEILSPESLTVHSLAIKRAAMLNREMEKYRSKVKGSTNEMLKLVDEKASGMDMNPYYLYRQKNIPGNLENIGYAKKGLESLYNILIMEEKQDIIAMGAGASTKCVYPLENRIERSENVKNVDHYIERIDEMIERKKTLLENRF
ncbi:MAG: coproporphyrinogen dehydrogenase HemZ [Lachnospiraceae bacterium]|nr:coproporphyrinogen dehydrogenase HemZ [Lachnospiraceae bacterium]